MVLPTQEIRLVLAREEGRTRTVRVYSPFLSIEGPAELGPDVEVWRVRQNYDFSPWVARNPVYLGDIEIGCEEDDGVINLGVVAHISTPGSGRPRVVTVLDPALNQIKIEADQIVEVVVRGSSEGGGEPWANVFPFDRASPDRTDMVEVLRTETVFLDAPVAPGGGLFRSSIWSESDLSDRADAASPKHRYQHHFWFRLKPDRLAEMCNHGQADVVPVAHLLFNDDHDCCRTLGLLASTRRVYKQVKRPRGLDMDLFESERWLATALGLAETRYDPTLGYLINPKACQDVSFMPDDMGLVIEIAEPAVFHSRLMPNARWTASIEPVLERSKTHVRMKLIDLVDRTINGHTIQRFVLIPTPGEYADSTPMLYLGRVTFRCDEIKPLGDRVVMAWLVQNKDRTVQHEFQERPPARELPTYSPSPPAKKKNDAYVYAPGVGKTYTPPPSSYHRVKFGSVSGDIRSLPTNLTCRSIRLGPANEPIGPTISNLFVGISLPAPPPMKEERPVSLRNDAPITLYTDPKNGDVINLMPGRYAAIRVPMKYFLSNSDLEFLYAANSFAIGASRVVVEGHRLIRGDKTGVYQEIRVSGVWEVPPAGQQLLLGGVVFENQYQRIVLPVVGTGGSEPPVPDRYDTIVNEIDALYRQAIEAKPATPTSQHLVVNEPDFTSLYVPKLHTCDRLTVRLGHDQTPGLNSLAATRHSIDSLPRWLEMVGSIDNGRQVEYEFAPNLVAQQLATGDKEIEDTLRFRVSDSIRILKLKLLPTAR
jgi:hypothetical protein